MSVRSAFVPRRPHVFPITATMRRQNLSRIGDYVATGDVGYLDDDGFLYISDRKTDMVISGGVNIYPAEIEKALVTLDEVRDCVVFGVPDKDFGERLVAIIDSGRKLEPGALTEQAATENRRVQGAA